MMKRWIASIPTSLLGKTVASLLLLLFLIFPFQKPLLHKFLKGFSQSIIPAHLELPSYFSTKMAFFLSEGVLILLLCHILYRKRDWGDFFWSGPSKYLTLLFIVALFSIGASATSNYLLMYTRFIEVALIAVLFNAIKTAFDAKTLVPFIKTLAWLIFFLSLLESAIALGQYFSQGRIGLKYLGECNRQFFCFFVPKGYLSLFDALLNIPGKTELLMRSTGTFPHPNVFGGFLFCAILMSFYLYFTHAKKTLLLGGIVFQMLALTVTFSRAAFIALYLAAAFWFILQARFHEQRQAVKHLVLTLLAATLLCFTLFFPQLAARGGFINYNGIVQGADSERLVYQKIALDMVQERPWFGVGLNNFQIESHRFFPNDRILPSKVHNIYLLFAAETGLIGALCFLLFLVSTMRHALQALSSQEGLLLLSLFLGFLFIGLCDFYFISTPHGQILFFGTAALLFAASKHLKEFYPQRL